MLKTQTNQALCINEKTMEELKSKAATCLPDSCHLAGFSTQCVRAITRPIALWISLSMLMFSARTYCQEAVRVSLASEQVAEAQHTSTASNYYNIQAGPVYLRFQGEMGLEFTDNANYSETSPDADIALLPTLNLKAFWPVTENNTLAVSVGIGYLEYLRDRALSHLNITSDSGLDFKVYSGDFVFDLHDHFSAVDYQTEDPSVSASLIRLENTPGLKVDWNLNKLIISLGYDYDTFSSLSGNYQYSDNASDLFTARAAFLLNTQNRLGLEAGGGVTTYDQNVLDNSTHFSIGPFYQAQLTPNIGIEAHAGFASYQFSHNGTVTNVSDFNGYYGDLTLNHQLNPWFEHSLSAGREIQLGITANLSDLYYVRYRATWNLIHNVSTSLGFEYDHGNTIGGVVENYDRYGPTISLGYRLTDKITTAVTYSYLDKQSDVPTLSYAQNLVLIDFTYAF
jgi:hypothetical protein